MHPLNRQITPQLGSSSNMSTSKTFYETLLAKAVPWILLVFICLIALFIPIVNSIHTLKCAAYVLLLLSLFCLVKSTFTRRAVVRLDANGIVVRGVRPGIWRWFQSSVVERIDDESVNLIRIGYLRDKHLGGVVSWSTDVPSNAANFYMFLWVKYNKHGREMEIYYPHLKNVGEFTELIKCLESRYGSKVEKHL
jgi:hypothetical protein